MTFNCTRWLVATAAAYLALQGTNFGTFWKSATYIGMLLLVMCVVIDADARRELRPPAPPLIVVVPFLFWIGWSALTWWWSIDPDFTRHELKGEALDLALMATLFYVVPFTTSAWRLIIGSSIGAFALLGLLAVVLAVLPWGWNADRFHGGIGPYSTYLVQTAPLLLWLVVPAPAGYGGGVRRVLAATGLLIVLIADARLTSNRNVWIALLALMLVLPLGAVRWRHSVRWREWALPLVGIAIILALGFADTLRKRTEQNYAPDTPVSQVIAVDPRIALWSLTWEKIRQRPLVGYGAGKTILAPELRRDLGDPLLTHAHNVFISQWLQKGAVGLAAFALTLLALAGVFAQFLRSRDDVLAAIGFTGIGILTGMIVKNLTDDFLFGTNGRQFWCLMALLVGYGVRRQRAALRDGLTPVLPVPVTGSAG
ncbi:MAG: O-antigen ligase family protein [Pseudomonadota bacterium]|nr:O-antigen ligase family protein [Pseudomonadota bacterium]